MLHSVPLEKVRLDRSRNPRSSAQCRGCTPYPSPPIYHIPGILGGPKPQYRLLSSFFESLKSQSINHPSLPAGSRKEQFASFAQDWDQPTFSGNSTEVSQTHIQILDKSILPVRTQDSGDLPINKPTKLTNRVITSV